MSILADAFNGNLTANVGNSGNLEVNNVQRNSWTCLSVAHSRIYNHSYLAIDTPFRNNTKPS